MSMSPDYVFDEDTDPLYIKDVNVIVIRAQKRNINKRIAEIRSYGDNTNSGADIIFRRGNINSVSLINHIRNGKVFIMKYEGIIFNKNQTFDDLVDYILSLIDDLFVDVIQQITHRVNALSIEI